MFLILFRQKLMHFVNYNIYRRRDCVNFTLCKKALVFQAHIMDKFCRIFETVILEKCCG